MNKLRQILAQEGLLKTASRFLHPLGSISNSYMGSGNRLSLDLSTDYTQVQVTIRSWASVAGGRVVNDDPVVFVVPADARKVVYAVNMAMSDRRYTWLESSKPKDFSWNLRDRKRLQGLSLKNAREALLSWISP